MEFKRVWKAVQKAKCENAVRRSVQELLKHSVDGAMGPSVDTLRARFHTFPKDDLGERTVPSRKKGGIPKQSPMIDASLQLGSRRSSQSKVYSHIVITSCPNWHVLASIE